MGRARTCGGWVKSLPDELKDCVIEEKLSYWIALLEPKSDAIQDLVSRDFDVHLDCFIATSEMERVSLDLSMLAAFAEIGVELEILLFPRVK